MKVKNISEDKKEFEPVSINITFESEEELGAFYALFNYSSITDELSSRGINTQAIRSALGRYKDIAYVSMWDFIDRHWSK